MTQHAIAHRRVRPRLSGVEGGRDCGSPVTYRVEVRDQTLLGFRIDSSQQAVPLRSTCHETIAGRAQPCPGCPALALAGSQATRRELSVFCDAVGTYRLCAGEALGEGWYILHSIPLRDALISSLQKLRLGRIARAAGLSKRELGVFELLLLGRSSAEMGAMLGITERTVRFHVSNILIKLEVESRADLVRLLV